MFTRERFEHELLKIKAQVGPNHIGCRGHFMREGYPCLMGQIYINLGSTKYRDFIEPPCNALGLELWNGHAEGAVLEIARRIADMNDAGTPWHQIIDMIVAENPRRPLDEPDQTLVPPVEVPEPEAAELELIEA